MQETTHIKHFKNYFSSLDWAISTVSTSLRTTLSTAARKGINLHLAKNLGVAVRKSHLARPLPSSVKPKECSQMQQPHWQGDTVVISRAPRARHEDCQERDVVRNMHVLIRSWAWAEQVPSSSSQLREGWPELEPRAGPDPQCPQGLREGSSNSDIATLKISQAPSDHSFSFKLIQLDTAMPLKPAKISLIKAGQYSLCCFHHADTLQVVHPQRIPIIKLLKTCMSQETQKAAEG